MGYALTAEQGDWKSCYELGRHMFGRGVEKSVGKAVHRFRQAERIGTAKNVRNDIRGHTK